MKIDQRFKVILRYGSILILGILIRISFVLSSHFPLNDGGLFLSMIQDIAANGGALPISSSYNGLAIPFVYPPLAFYIVYILHTVFSFSNLDLMIYLPVIFSCLTLAAFIYLAKIWLREEREILIALLLFAVMPRSFIWMIMGGGLTRAPGFFFSLLSIAYGSKLYTTGRTRYGVLCAITGALAALTHLEKAWFVVFSLGLLLVLKGRNRKAILHSIFVVILVLFFTAPWWFFIIQNHGFNAFMAAFMTRSAEWELWLPMLRYLVLALLGMLVCLRKKDYFLPLWLPIIFLLDPRSAATIARVPLSLLLSLGIWYVLFPSLRRLRGASPPATSEVQGEINLVKMWPFSKFDVPYLTRTLDRMLAFFVLVAVFSIGIDYYGATITLHALSEREIRMMIWIREEIPPDHTFLIISGEGWQKDEIAEWFPVLAERRSLATVQGYEWTTPTRFYDQWHAHIKAQSCPYLNDLTCILDWKSEGGEQPDFLYYAMSHTTLFDEDSCCQDFVAQLNISNQFELVHQENGSLLFRFKREFSK